MPPPIFSKGYYKQTIPTYLYYTTGDVLTFTLDCDRRTLAVSINDLHKITIPEVILPAGACGILWRGKC